MSWLIDLRITSTCFELGDWPLSRVFFKNNANYPWFILVPRQDNIQEIDQLSIPSQHVLIEEISTLSRLIKQQFKPDKLNVGILGNIVPQLHIHVIARFKQDSLWPHSVWQELLDVAPYQTNEISTLLATMQPLIKNAYPEVDTKKPTI